MGWLERWLLRVAIIKALARGHIGVRDATTVLKALRKAKADQEAA